MIPRASVDAPRQREGEAPAEPFDRRSRVQTIFNQRFERISHVAFEALLLTSGSAGASPSRLLVGFLMH